MYCSLKETHDNSRSFWAPAKLPQSLDFSRITLSLRSTAAAIYSVHYVSYETLYLIKSELLRVLNLILGHSINSLITCLKENQIYIQDLKTLNPTI